MAHTAAKRKNSVPASPDPMLPRRWKIEKRIRETHDTFTLILSAIESDNDFRFDCGQFNMLYLYGTGEVPISISGDPADHKRLVHTIRAVGNVTNNMSRLKPRDIIGVRGPFGTGWPIDKANGSDLVIVAGGIGLAPLRPVIYRALANRQDFGRVILLYGSRTPEDLLYRREIEKWRARLDVEVLVTVDRAVSTWKGNVGVVTKLIPKAGFDPMHTVAMICGPEIMMRFTAAELMAKGVSKDRIYISMERNMRCGIGLCGHCQMGPTFICKDGPVYRYDYMKDMLTRREI